MGAEAEDAGAGVARELLERLRLMLPAAAMRLRSQVRLRLLEALEEVGVVAEEAGAVAADGAVLRRRRFLRLPKLR